MQSWKQQHRFRSGWVFCGVGCISQLYVSITVRVEVPNSPPVSAYGLICNYINGTKKIHALVFDQTKPRQSDITLETLVLSPDKEILAAQRWLQCVIHHRKDPLLLGATQELNFICSHWFQKQGGGGRRPRCRLDTSYWSGAQQPCVHSNCGNWPGDAGAVTLFKRSWWV